MRVIFFAIAAGCPGRLFGTIVSDAPKCRMDRIRTDLSGLSCLDGGVVSAVKVEVSLSERLAKPTPNDIRHRVGRADLRRRDGCDKFDAGDLT